MGKKKRLSRNEKDQREQLLLQRQMMDLDVYICRLYQCVACKRFLTRKRVKYFYRRPWVRTMIYGKGAARVIPVLCNECMHENTFMTPWVRKWWDILPRPKLDWVHYKKPSSKNLGAKKLKPWEKGYANDLYNTVQEGLKKTPRKKPYGLFRRSDVVPSDPDGS